MTTNFAPCHAITEEAMVIVLNIQIHQNKHHTDITGIRMLAGITTACSTAHDYFPVFPRFPLFFPVSPCFNNHPGLLPAMRLFLGLAHLTNLTCSVRCRHQSGYVHGRQWPNHHLKWYIAAEVWGGGGGAAWSAQRDKCVATGGRPHSGRPQGYLVKLSTRRGKTE